VDALEASPAAAANMKARADLMIALRETIDGWSVSQAAAAKRLGLTQPRLNDLLRDGITKFSLDALMEIASRGGLKGAPRDRAPSGVMGCDEASNAPYESCGIRRPHALS